MHVKQNEKNMVFEAFFGSRLLPGAPEALQWMAPLPAASHAALEGHLLLSQEMWPNALRWRLLDRK